MPLKKTTVLGGSVTALFAGIGGFELGLQRSGFHPAAFCEIDPEAQAVLKSRFECDRIFPDVRDADKLIREIPRESEILTAGFPCTDLSQAGETKGFAGDQSSLILDVLRLLASRRFDTVVIENVPNWRVLHRGDYLRHVLVRLQALGYRWAYRTIDAMAFGAPQRRLRIFLVASLTLDPRQILFPGNCEPDTSRAFALDETAHGFYWTEGNRGLGWGEDCVPTLKGGSGVGIPSAPAILRTDGSIVTPDIRDAERLQGFKAGWTDCALIETKNGKRAFNQRRRWMLVGNAVNVDVATWLGERLASANAYDGPEGQRLDKNAVLPPAAWGFGKNWFGVDLTTWPVKRRRLSLEGFLKHPGKPLSYRAAAGFYSRISKSTLHFVTGFKKAVRIHRDEMKRLENGQAREIALAFPPLHSSA